MNFIGPVRPVATSSEVQKREESPHKSLKFVANSFGANEASPLSLQVRNASPIIMSSKDLSAIYFRIHLEDKGVDFSWLLRSQGKQRGPLITYQPLNDQVVLRDPREQLVQVRNPIRSELRKDSPRLEKETSPIVISPNDFLSGVWL